MGQKEDKERAGDGEDDEDCEHNTSDAEDVEDMDAILQRVMEIREHCHLEAKENMATAQQKHAEVPIWKKV